MPDRIVGGLKNARDSIASKASSRDEDDPTAESRPAQKAVPGVSSHLPDPKVADKQSATPHGDRLGGLKEDADRNLGAVSSAIYGAEETLEDWALAAMSKLRTYFHNAEEAGKRGIHYAEHLQQRQEDTAASVGRPADRAGQKVAAVARDAAGTVGSGVEGLSHGATRAKETAKAGLARAEKAADYASETTQAVKSGIDKAEETAESALERAVDWFYNTEEAAKRGVHYAQSVGQGAYGAAESAVDGVKSVAAGVASRATDVKEAVKKGIHYAESAYGNADSALGRVLEKVAEAEDTGKDVLARTASYVQEVSPTSGSDEADLVNGGARARQTWEQAASSARSGGGWLLGNA